MTDPNQPTPIAGMLVIDKPLKCSSARAVAVVKARLRAGGQPKSIKVGHAGTLDPLATGVLVVMVGKATKLSGSVMDGKKRYETHIDLSAFTNTDDAEGEREEIAVEIPPTLEKIKGILADHFTGVIQQTPPAFSAIKLGGERAYALARAGKPVEMKPRPITVHTIEILSYEYPRLTLDIRCGKGTYIRSIARDLGKALGTGGTLSGLRRTQVGQFTLEQAITLDDLPDPLPISALMTTPETAALVVKHSRP